MPHIFLFLVFKNQRVDTRSRSEVAVFMASPSPAAPQYRAPFSVDSNLTTVCVDWSGSFLLHGPLKEFVLTDGGQRLYRGLDTAHHLPRTAGRSESPTSVSQRGRCSAPQLSEVVALHGGPRGLT